MPTRPRLAASSDPADRLPPAAGQKLRRLRERAADIGAALRDVTDQRNDAVAAKQRADARRRQLLEDPIVRQEGDDHPSLAQAARDRDAAAGAIAELDQRAARLRQRQPLIVAAIEQWLRSIPAAAEIAEHGEPVAPKLLRGEAPGAAVQRARADVARIKAEIRDTLCAPVPSDVIKQRVRDDVDALARRGRPDMLRMVETGCGVPWPTATLRGTIAGHAVVDGTPPIAGFSTHTGPDEFAILCWLRRDEIVARLEQEVDELADDGAALTDEQRAEREAALTAELLQAERVEEALIEQLEAAGGEVVRRPDADPRAVLGLSTSLPGPR